MEGHTEGRCISQYLISKELLKKKATLTLLATNLYSKYLSLQAASTALDFSQSPSNQFYYRSFGIRCNDRFRKLNSEIKKNQHGINNDDLKGNDSNGGGN
jgi:hypothetical protein